MPRALRTLLALTAALALTLGWACGPARASTTAGSPVVGRAGVYDYSPSVMQSGTGGTAAQDFWWCGYRSPGDPATWTDTIQYEQIGLSPLRVVTGPVTVLGEGAPGAWDSAYVCNPKVVAGTFVNPLGDGVTYAYALYYVGTATPAGTDNSIGVAFSSDGRTWHKYPTPVITHTSTGGVYYGVGQPDVYNSAGVTGSSVQLVYEDTNTGPANTTHVLTASSDGVHFTTAGALSTTGLAHANANLDDLAYDPVAATWYGEYDQPARPPATTGGVTERGQPGVQLYSTGSLLTGTWTPLDTIDTNLTGYESNFLGSFLHQPDGTILLGSGSSVEVYLSTSVPRPAAGATPAQRGQSGDVHQWDIAWSTWYPGSPQRALTRYYSAALGVHEVTTGWADTGAFHTESTLGHLYETATGAFARPLYGCVAGTDDYLVSPDPACEGQLTLGLDGYISPTPAPGLIALYRCYTGSSHMVSTDPLCEGTRTESLLGYAAP